MKKRILASLVAVGLVASMVLTGCAGNPSSDESDSSASGDGASEGGYKIAILADSGVDDGSFNQNCYEGILQYIDEVDPASTVTEIKEPDLSKCIQTIEDTIADYDIMVLPGYNYAACAEICQANPDKKIILVDSYPTTEDGEEIVVDNVYAMQFAEQESGFLAGIAAAMETKTGKVAVVNGIAYPSNVNYQYGFESGVNYAVKNLGATAECVEIASYAGTDVTGADVGGNYIGAFDDVETGKVVGNALLDQGVDIIFVAAGASGNGVFTAVKEAGDAYCIGCDVDQYDDGANGDSNIILTSALKVMDVNVYRQLCAIKDGTFEGQNIVLYADTDSTGLVTEEGRCQLSQETIDAVNTAFEGVKDGSIVPAANFNDMTPDNFTGL